MTEARPDRRGPLIGAVLVGGKSSRFGRDKSLAPVGESTMGALVVSALRRAGLDPVVAVGGTAGDALGLPTVPDRWVDRGPLSGLASVLLWAKEGSVLVAHCDLPRLHSDDVAAIAAAAQKHPECGIVATCDGRRQTQLLCLPASAADRVRTALNRGSGRLRSVFDSGTWIEVPVRRASVSDVDTPAALNTVFESDTDL